MPLFPNYTLLTSTFFLLLIFQLLQDLNTAVGVVTGAVRQLVTPEGEKIKKLDELQDGGKYVCCGAEKLKLDARKYIDER
jgi:hypothetical protein